MDDCESVSVFHLTTPQKRHLREMLDPSGETRYWRPSNAGEHRCAAKLRKLGLLEGSVVTVNDAYYLSDVGLRMARGLVSNPDV